MSKRSLNKEYSRQSVRGIFFCKKSVNREDCRKLVQDLGCTVILENPQSLMIQASRSRLQELKARYLAPEDDISQISSRLKQHFDRILIGGATR